DLDGTLVDTLPLAYCAERFGVPNARLLMVGDSANDTAAARAASCPVFCVAHGYRGGMALHELDCDAILTTVLDCLELIRPVRS
ncbi:MAG: HAD hydrolase-like protein, partial [Burkholderiales bacterium]